MTLGEESSQCARRLRNDNANPGGGYKWGPVGYLANITEDQIEDLSRCT